MTRFEPVSTGGQSPAATPQRQLILAAGSMLDQPAEVVIDAAAAAGFSGVGLRVSHDHVIENAIEIRDRAERSGVVIHDTEVHRISLVAPDPAPLIEQSVALGAQALLAVSDLRDHRATAEAVGRLTNQCRQHGLQLALEYMAWTTPSQPLVAVEIAQRTGCILVVDLLHHVRVGAGVAELQTIIESGTIGWVQISDAPLADPPADVLVHEARHLRMCPGRGELPLADLLAVVPDSTTISVEVQSDDLLSVSPAERARLLYECARSVLHA
jgi:sugar phosphate isomerase/epimerase